MALFTKNKTFFSFPSLFFLQLAETRTKDEVLSVQNHRPRQLYLGAHRQRRAISMQAHIPRCWRTYVSRTNKDTPSLDPSADRERQMQTMRQGERHLGETLIKRNFPSSTLAVLCVCAVLITPHITLAHGQILSLDKINCFTMCCATMI